MLAPVYALCEIFQYTLSNILGLFVLIGGNIQNGKLAHFFCSPEFLALSSPVVADNCVGGFKNMAGTSVVLLKLYDSCIFILLFKIENILYGRAAEFINTLVIVADNAYVLITACKSACKKILKIICVLILVNKNISEFSLIVISYILIFLQKLDRIENKIIKIHCVGIAHTLCIFPVKLTYLYFAHIIALFCLIIIIIGREHFILCLAYDRKNIAERKHFFVKVKVLDDTLHKTLAVRGIINRKRTAEAKTLRVTAQNSYAGGMEGLRPDVVGPFTQSSLKAAF